MLTLPNCLFDYLPPGLHAVVLSKFSVNFRFMTSGFECCSFGLC